MLKTRLGLYAQIFSLPGRVVLISSYFRLYLRLSDKPKIVFPVTPRQSSSAARTSMPFICHDVLFMNSSIIVFMLMVSMLLILFVFSMKPFMLLFLINSNRLFYTKK